MIKLLTDIKKNLIIIGILFFPVFVLPGFPSAYVVPKEIFGIIIVSLVLVVIAVRSIAQKEVKFAAGKFDFGVFLLTLAYLLSTIIKTPNKMEAFLYPGTTTFIFISVLFYFIVNQLPKRGKNAALLAIFASGIILAVISLFAKAGVYTKIPQLPAFIHDANFNALGSSLQSVIYLLVVLPIGIVNVIKNKDLTKKVFFSVSSIVILLDAILTGINLLPGKAQAVIISPLSTSWAIAIEAIKQNPVLGAGPANYLSAFNMYRPVSYNLSNLWQARFSVANNYYFTVITELGLLGLASLTILMIQIGKKIAQDYAKKSWEEISLVILIIAFTLFPSVPALIFLFMALLAVFSGSEEKTFTIAQGKVPTIIVYTPVILGIATLSFFGSRAVLAEHYYQKALTALSSNDAVNTYLYIAQAEKLNPYVDRYHTSAAQIDMAIASTLASNKTLTDTDKNTISQLVQEAITEGKAGVTLNIGRSGNWEILGQVYKSIMTYAEGASQFTVQTYIQAVALDPTSPTLRVNLGGIYYALGEYDNAIDAFKLAITAKQDYANAYYNLAYTYAAKKDYTTAASYMETVLGLVKKDSDDYKTAQSALEEFNKMKPATNESSSDTLTKPETIQTSKTNISLPEVATPPAVTN